MVILAIQLYPGAIQAANLLISLGLFTRHID